MHIIIICLGENLAAVDVRRTEQKAPSNKKKLKVQNITFSSVY